MTDNSKIRKILIYVIIITVVTFGILTIKFFMDGKKKPTEIDVKPVPLKTELKMTDNSMTDFDLYFLQLENAPKNKVYSPISMKYALAMLNEGAEGETKKQISEIVGGYQARSYVNSDNMSFANALFVKEGYPIKDSYINTLKNQYDAEIMYDKFESPDNINNWVKEKTFELIPETLKDVKGLRYAIVNALAIDMEWEQQIQNYFKADISHERGIADNKTIDHVGICDLEECGYSSLKLNNKDTKAVSIAAFANKYDIVNELGEDNIRETLNREYENWVKENENKGYQLAGFDTEEYISQLRENYGKFGSSTDFLFYDNDKVKAFAKDLKTYDGVTLEYVGIMPKDVELTEYVKNADAANINGVINNLKPINLDSFEEGYLTVIEGHLPLFDYDYELQLKDDLQKIGITDVFNSDLANLSNISEKRTYIEKAIHKAKIEFSNKGIKAAAVTLFGGVDAAAFDDVIYFNYNFDVPAKYIDLTFDKPYMYVIRDKNSGEVWFTGTVYEGLDFSYNDYE